MAAAGFGPAVSSRMGGPMGVTAVRLRKKSDWIKAEQAVGPSGRADARANGGRALHLECYPGADPNGPAKAGPATIDETPAASLAGHARLILAVRFG